MDKLPLKKSLHAAFEGEITWQVTYDLPYLVLYACAQPTRHCFFTWIVVSLVSVWPLKKLLYHLLLLDHGITARSYPTLYLYSMTREIIISSAYHDFFSGQTATKEIVISSAHGDLVQGDRGCALPNSPPQVTANTCSVFDSTSRHETGTGTNGSLNRFIVNTTSSIVAIWPLKYWRIRCSRLVQGNAQYFEIWTNKLFWKRVRW